MKILIVPTSDWLGHPFPSRLHHIFEKIAENNEVHVLRFSFYDKKRIETKTIVHEINGSNPSGLAQYYISNAPKHFRTIRKIVRENQIDRLVVSNLLAGYIAAKAVYKRIPTVFDLSDHFPTSGAGYYFALDSALGRIATFALEKLLKRTLDMTNKTVTCSQVLKNYVEKLGIKESLVIPNGVDDFFISKRYDGKSIREKYNLDGHLVLGYIGSIEFWLDMLPMLEAIHKLLAEGHKIKLFLVGSKLRTEMSKKVQIQITNLGLENNVVWLNKFVPYHEVPKYMSAMDICTIPFNHKVPTAYYSAPNKLWEYLALGKPVIVAPIPDPIYQARRHIDIALTSHDYIRIIKSYMKNPDQYLAKAYGAQELVGERTWTNISQRYETLLESLS